MIQTVQEHDHWVQNEPPGVNSPRSYSYQVVDEKLRLGLFLRQPAYLSFSEKILDAGVGHLSAIL